MCRFTVYKGRPVLLGEILIRPDNSLLRQARDSSYHPGVVDNTNLRNIIVNGDGFGLAWYTNDPERGACCCKFLTPAWSNINLRNLGDYVTAPLMIGHVRAASSGHNHLEDVAVSSENCHPFKYRRFTFVHNGTIPQFKKIKRAMVMLMKDECFHDISGSTDSECIFALFLSLLPDRDADVTLEQIKSTINFLISTILELMSSSSIDEPCSLNMCITDGTHMVATRYRNGPEDPPSLYYKYGTNFRCVKGQLFSCDAAPPSELIITSAPLSRDDGASVVSTTGCWDAVENSSWVLIPKDHMLVCTGDPTNISRVVSVESVSIDAEVGKGQIFSMRKHLRRSPESETVEFMSKTMPGMFK